MVKRTWCLVLALFMLSLCLAPTVDAAKGGIPGPPSTLPNGRPFQIIQGMINNLQAQINNLFAQHFTELTFTVDPGDPFSFALPKQQVPVRIEVTFSLLNAGTQTPSEIMFAVVNQDPSSGQMTWVGTNNDATSQAGNTVNPGFGAIANIFGEAAPTVNASLQVDSLADSTLKITQSAATTALPGNYVVHLWF